MVSQNSWKTMELKTAIYATDLIIRYSPKSNKTKLLEEIVQSALEKLKLWGQLNLISEDNIFYNITSKYWKARRRITFLLTYQH